MLDSVRGRCKDFTVVSGLLYVFGLAVVSGGRLHINVCSFYIVWVTKSGQYIIRLDRDVTNDLTTTKHTQCKYIFALY